MTIEVRCHQGIALPGGRLYAVARLHHPWPWTLEADEGEFSSTYRVGILPPREYSGTYRRRGRWLIIRCGPPRRRRQERKSALKVRFA